MVLYLPLFVITLMFFSSDALPVNGCSCDKFVETYAEEGPFSIDLYATMGPVRRVDYSNSCSHVKVSCSVVPDNWDSDVWAVFNGTMKSMITASSRIFCDEKSATWQVDLKTGERTIWAGVSVYSWAVIAVLFLLKGSIWKLIWREMIGWTVIMALLYVLYVHVLKDTVYEEYYTFLIDLTRDVPTDGTLMFVLSYMTYNSLTRWSDTFKCLAWPENVALMFKQYCNKRALSKYEARCLFRAVARYLTVFYILVFRDVSTDVRDMFPTFNDMILPGILTKEEVEILRSSRLDRNSCHYWIPIDWIVIIVRDKYRPKYSFDRNMRKVRNKKETIMTEVQYFKFINEICKIKARVGDVLSYDWVPLPLALFQSLTIFVYSTLVVNIFQMQARIIMSGNPGISEMFVESMSTLPFSMLYLSFLRISQVVINPFGRDDDDFETQYLIDRHIKALNEILCNDEEEQKEEKKKRK